MLCKKASLCEPALLDIRILFIQRHLFFFMLKWILLVGGEEAGQAAANGLVFFF